MNSNIVRREFDERAPYYDFEIKNNNWLAPSILFDDLAILDLLNPSFSVLDVGCGTGVSGKFFSSRGFNNLDGIDISSKMIEVARSKEIYKNILLADIKDREDLVDLESRYDILFSVGVLGDFVKDIKKGLENICFLGKEKSVVAFCGDDYKSESGINDENFVRSILSEQGFRIASSGRKYAYNFGMGRRKNYSYYVAVRD